MSRLREHRRRARGDLHREMSVAALYIAVPDADPVPCTVRIWLKGDGTTGDLPGFQGAERAEPEDRLRFDLSEFTPPMLRQGAVVSVDEGEAYRIEFLYPVDQGYQTARVTRLTAALAAPLPLPEDDE